MNIGDYTRQILLYLREVDIDLASGGHFLFKYLNAIHKKHPQDDRWGIAQLLSYLTDKYTTVYYAYVIESVGMGHNDIYRYGISRAQLF